MNYEGRWEGDGLVGHGFDTMGEGERGKAVVIAVLAFLDLIPALHKVLHNTQHNRAD